MTFDDLPTDWTNKPLYDSRLGADVVDLLLRLSDRARNSLLLLPCDADGRGLPTPVVISDVRWSSSPRPLLDFWDHIVSETNAPAALIATSHPGVGQPQWHRRWLTRIATGLQSGGTDVVGCYTADMDQIHAGPSSTRRVA